MSKSKIIKKSKLLICLLAALLALFVLSCLVWARHPQGTARTLDEVCVQVDRGISSAEVRLWREGWPEDGDVTETEPGEGWFFLPSYAQLDRLCFLYDDSCCTLLLDGRALPSGVHMPAMVDGGIYVLSFIGEDGVQQDLTVHFVQSGQLPTVFINTESGSMAAVRADKTYHENAEIKIVDANGKLSCAAALCYVKGHGNQTLDYDKRSLTLKLDATRPLLGMESGREWVLLSNVYDDTQLRNKIMYDLAAGLGLEYSPESRYCEVYLNGSYAGLYLLCEKVVLGENRVDISDLEARNTAANGDTSAYPVATSEDGRQQYTQLPNDPADITGGYLLERDYGEKFSNDPSWFVTDSGETMVIKSPDNASEAQLSYISGVFQQLENAILAPDGIDPESGRYYTDILDLDSWASLYLLDEFSKQEGAGVTSSWYYKDSDSVDSLVYSGPIWDYDKALGRYRKWASPLGLTYLSLHEYKSCWFAALYEKEDFRQTVIERYQQQLIPLLQQLCEQGLDDYAGQIRAGWDMDKLRWGRHGLYNVVSSYDTLDQCVEYLRSWISQRMEFLQSVWIDGETWYTVTTDNSLADTQYCYLYAREGEGVGTLPDARDGEGDFLFWVVSGTGEVFTAQTPVYEDLQLEAVWSGAAAG